jgi:TrmH family RNA methyltransferase
MIPENNSLLKPLKWYRALAEKENRLEAGAFILEGERAIRQVMLSHPDAILEILTTEEQPSFNRYPGRLLTRVQMRTISTSITPQGTAALVAFPREIYSRSLPPSPAGNVLLLEYVQDPGNVGTLIRTAAAFNYTGVILSDRCADPLSPKCVQSSAGATLSLWLRKSTGYLEMALELKKRGFVLVATDLSGAADVGVVKQPQGLLLALGNEAAGLSEPALDICHHRIRIPIAVEKAESLNVAACGAICMYLSRYA